MIVTEEKKLRQSCDAVESLEEGAEIAKKLFKILKSSDEGIGLAANQIGINKRVCVINVSKPLVLINPKIVSSFGKTMFKEGCLSFPGIYVLTKRYKNILVKADNHSNFLKFRCENFKDALECVCVQHEIDHLNGITMFEREYK